MSVARLLALGSRGLGELVMRMSAAIAPNALQAVTPD
jgi:hypothetical protein